MKVPVGQPVPIVLQLPVNDNAQFPLAYSNDFAGNLLATITLVNDGKGAYIPDSDYLMPDIENIYVNYEVFSDSGHTSSNTNWFGVDVYQRDDGGDCPTAAEIAAEVDVVLSAAHGSGSWEGGGSTGGGPFPPQAPLFRASGVPFVGDTLQDWMQSITLGILTKETVNFQVVETVEEVSFMGVWQPFTDRQLQLKPEGERAWTWIMLHTPTSVQLGVDGTVYYLGVQYRVMALKDYTLYGYLEYHLIQDFTGSGPEPA